MASPTDTTDKMFPPPESGERAAAPIPLTPSVREEFLAHRLHLDRQATLTRQSVEDALERLKPADVTPRSALQTLGKGAALGGKYGGIVLAGLGVLQAVVKVFKPALAGPLDSLIQLFGG